MNETIVIVPGMYSPRLVMALMARRLRHRGFSVNTLSNRYLMCTPAENAQRMLRQIQALDASTVHLLGHSLGGIVIMHLLGQNRELPAEQRISNGKVVLMATPLRGSELAKRLHSKRWFKLLMGKSVYQGLLGDAPMDRDGRDVGVMSGSSRMGFSSLMFRPTDTNDGVVRRIETKFDAATDEVCVPHAHALMLFSDESVNKVANFFRYGCFDGDKRNHTKTR